MAWEEGICRAVPFPPPCWLSGSFSFLLERAQPKVWDGYEQLNQRLLDAVLPWKEVQGTDEQETSLAHTSPPL